MPTYIKLGGGLIHQVLTTYKEDIAAKLEKIMVQL